MSTPSALVQKLWNYCSILRDDGLSYRDYVEQLTNLLFLKMGDEQSRPPFNPPSCQGYGGTGKPSAVPKGVRLAEPAGIGNKCEGSPVVVLPDTLALARKDDRT